MTFKLIDKCNSMINTKFTLVVKRVFAICIILLSVSILYSQNNVTVQGNVYDKQDDPLIGVAVRVVGASVGALTDIDGKFTIECPPQAQLQISYVGYETQVIALNGRTQLHVVLSEDTKVFDEVVVVGYGVQRKSDLTGSVASIKAADAVKTMPTSNITDAIQGRLSGVSIISASGSPNSSATIRVRGVNSISADIGPLVVIDGFIGGSLNSLNPSDILSIEVLKDASSTAIYGSRGANGVILVTTKNPEDGKIKVDYSGYLNVKTPYKLPNMLSPGQFARLANDYRAEMQALGVSTGFQEYTADEIAAFDNGAAGFDYIGNIFNQTAIQHVHELSISGGSGKTNYLFSGSYNQNEGIVKSSKGERANYRLKVDSKISDIFSVGLNFWGDYSKSQGPRFSQYRGVLIESLIFPNTILPRDSEGRYNNKNLSGPQYNPMGHIEQVDRDGYAYNSFLQGYMDIQLMKGLTFRMQQGFTFGNSLSMNTNNSDSYAAWANGITDAGATNTSAKNWINSNILTYIKEFNDNHRINSTLVFEQQQSNNFMLRGTGVGLSSIAVGYNNLAFSQRVTADSYKRTNTMMSALARVNYVFMNRYMLTASYRRDGSSRLAYQNRWEDFISAAVAWDLSQEEFIRNLNTFSQFKLRLGYGETGNQAVAEYSAYTEYQATRDADQNLILSLKRIGNPNLKWERTNQYNLGLDLGFFKNRLTANVDMYHKMSKDVLLEVDIPMYTGFLQSLSNTAHILNQGVEITLGADPYVGRDFAWNTNLTLSFNDTKIVKLADGKSFITLGTTYENSFYRFIEGERLGTIYGYKSLGVWKSWELGDAPTGTEAGSYKYENVDQSPNNTITADDQKIIGNGQPLFNWGWTNTLNLKNFDISLFVIGYHGFDIYNYTAQARMGLTPNPVLLDRWTPENENSTIAGFVKLNNLKPVTSQFIEKGDFVKVKSITLGYTLPQSIVNKIHLKNLRVYSSIQNPFLITSYSGIDPEVTLQDPLKPGIDYGYYPNGRNYLIGLNITF